MKVALSTDWIFERDHSIEMLDMLAELYREAPLYTLAFKENSLLGPVSKDRFILHFYRIKQILYQLFLNGPLVCQV